MNMKTQAAIDKIFKRKYDIKTYSRVSEKGPLLSNRDRDIIDWMLAGYSYKAIANLLKIGLDVVTRSVNGAVERNGCRGTYHLVAMRYAEMPKPKVTQKEVKQKAVKGDKGCQQC